MVLGALVLGGWLAQATGPERAPLVWENLEKIQGRFAGTVFRRGHRILVVIRPDGTAAEIMVDKTVKLKGIPEPGWPVEITAAHDNHQLRLVRAQDFRRIREVDPDRQVSDL